MFYTILPQWPLIKPKFKRIARFAPLIGIFIGLIQSSIWIILNSAGWPNISSCLISLIVSICITGGIHVDGLMDTADGIGAGPSKRKKAMKDSRVGAIGVQSLLIIFIIQIASILKLDLLAPFTFPLVAFWGRFSQILAIGNFSYSGGKGSNSLHKKHWRGTASELIPSLIIIFSFIIIFLFLTELNRYNISFLLISLVSGLCSSIFIAFFINRIVGGHSGDTYGATLLTTETLTLFLISIFFGPK